MATRQPSPESYADPARHVLRSDNNLVDCVDDECDLVSDDVTFLLKFLNFAIIVQIIDVFGTGTNIISIICFVKQGLKDPVNVVLLGLTVSDLLSQVSLIWNNICLNPFFSNSNLPVWSPSTAYLTAGIPHVAFTRVTCCITALLTLERCLCVVFPLKVQLILTPRMVSIIVIAIYMVILSANIVPVYYSTRFVVSPHPGKPNTTWLAIAFTEDLQVVEKFSFPINSGLLPFSTFAIVFVSTAILVEELKRKAKWRKLFNAPSHSARDKSVSKMVVVIAMLFVICYTPICSIFIAMIVVPEFAILGHYKNLNAVLVSLAYILESVNASCNIFIYYNTSSRYREAFTHVFNCHRSKDRSTHCK